jgi:NADP-dependent 3-hydroxy acid dehydrogenase YdfG
MSDSVVREPATTNTYCACGPNPLHGQIALVTGASSGIGRCIARDLAGNGAEVCLVARRRAVLQEVAEEIGRNGSRAHVFETDLTHDEAVLGLSERLAASFGRLNVLVLCAGVIVPGLLKEAAIADMDAQYRSNIRAPYELTRLMLPLLRRAAGHIVFINSSAGLRSPAAVGQFAATQHALRCIADTLRDEVNVDGIRVTSIYPGRTATPRIAAVFEREGRAYRPELLMQPSDVAKMVTYTVSLPRTAEITDISMRPMCKSY